MKTCTAASGKFTISEGSEYEGWPIATLRYSRRELTTGQFIISVHDRLTNALLVQFSNITGAPGFGNTLNGHGSAAISNLWTSLESAFNVTAGSGGGGGDASEATLVAINGAVAWGNNIIPGEITLSTNVITAGSSEIIGAGYRSVIIVTTPDAVATINNKDLPSGVALSWDMQPGQTFPEFTIDVVTGKVYVYGYE